MVVSQITGNKFNPFEAYRHLYFLQESFFEESQVPEELRQRYRSLHEKLVIEYTSWVSHGQSQTLPNPYDPRDAEQQLADFLAGPRVTARSDDDLTLVLVARDHA